MRILRSAMICMLALSSTVIMPVAHADTFSPGASLWLKVELPDGFAYETTLTCMPAGGDHTYPEMACNNIKAARGDFNRLHVQDWRVCTKESAPVRLAALGVWRGHELRWSKTFGNECEAHRNTNQTFDW